MLAKKYDRTTLNISDNRYFLTEPFSANKPNLNHNEALGSVLLSQTTKSVVTL